MPTLEFIVNPPAGATSLTAAGDQVNPQIAAALPGFFNVQAYGATGNGSTDDTAAIQSAINAAATVNSAGTQGGTVYFPPGVYACSGQLSLPGLKAIKLLGAGGLMGADKFLTDCPSSTLLFTGTGSTWPTNLYGLQACIDARSTIGFTMDGLGVITINPTYSGLLLDLSHYGSGGNDSSYYNIRHCAFADIYNNGTNYLITPAAGISLANTIIGTVEACFFARTLSGIRGVEAVGASIGYANMITIRDCTFIQTPSAITNPGGEQFVIEGNTFEGLQQTATDYMHHMVSSDISDKDYVAGPIVRNNWCGDAFGDQVWVRLQPGGGTYEDNFFSGGNGGIQFYNDGPSQHGAGPCRIKGNAFSVAEFAIDCTSGNNIIWEGLEIGSNDFSLTFSSGPILNLPTGSPNRDTALFANKQPSNPYLGSPFFLTAATGAVASSQQSGNYTFALLDAGTVVECTDASAATFTIPLNSSVAFPVGTEIEVFQNGAGQVTIAGAAGVTLVSDGSKVHTAAQYATIRLRQRSTNIWALSGDLV